MISPHAVSKSGTGGFGQLVFGGSKKSGLDFAKVAQAAIANSVSPTPLFSVNPQFSFKRVRDPATGLGSFKVFSVQISSPKCLGARSS